MEIRVRNGLIEVDGVAVAQILPSADEKIIRHDFERLVEGCECDPSYAIDEALDEFSHDVITELEGACDKGKIDIKTIDLVEEAMKSCR